MSQKIRDENKRWLNSAVFREEAIRFQMNGAFCNAPDYSPDWYNYWEEQLRRCIEGYEVDGQKITGHHYFYLNFTQIQIVEQIKGSKASKKITQQPDFWDGDYDYFWSLEIAKNGLFSDESQVITSVEERNAWDAIHLEMDELKMKLGTSKAINTEEYSKLAAKRNIISTTVLNRLGLKVKIHPDYLNGGYHMIVGKEQPNSCIVKTPFGDKRIGDLQVGEIIQNSYSSMSKVISVNPQGLKDVYEITLFDGRKTRCGLEHLWEIFGPVYKKDTRKVETLELKDLLDRPLKVGTKYKSFIKIADAVQHIETYLPIPPYSMGAFLGDGNTTKQLKLSGIDEELLNNVLTELNMFFDTGEYYVSGRHGFNWALRYRPYGTNRKGNPIYAELRDFNLNCISKHKFIPEIYKTSSIAQRIELVKGLMDTDGSISEDGAMTFGNTSERLVKDLQGLLYSLGVQATYRVRKDGIHMLYINSTINLFGIARKKVRFRPERKSRKYVAIVDIKKLDYQEESTCILVDSEDHTYLTDEYIVTHNSRRKGYSYKDGAICANVYNTVRNCQIIIGATEKKFLYPKGTMGMASDYLNFLNEHTGWAKSRDYVDKQDHKRASYKTTVNGTIIEKGYKSEIFALSFKDNPDAARGKDAKIILLEEAGAFPNLKDSFAAIVPALTAGSYITGQIIIFGTGGDMESGTVDFADMFYNPEVYGLLPFVNTWDADAENSTCGFFHPVTWNMEGFYDENGNSDIEAATNFEDNRRRAILEKSSSSATLQKHIQEFPFCPSEAFLTVSTNNFPVVELRNQLNKVIHEKLQFTKGTPVYLDRKDGKVVAKPDLHNKLQPILNYRPKVDDLSGCPIIYEYPIDNPPKGLYKIGYDPYRQDLSSGVSLASIYVYKSSHKFSYNRNMIVAEYVGRPQEADDVNRIASQLADLYNAEIMHENEVTHVKNYFRRIRRLDQLAIQPDAVISKSVKNSTVARVYGIHMPDKIKDDGEKYIKDWLLEVRDYDENGSAILNLETIYSIGLLEELIQYNKKGNFDRCLFAGTKVKTRDSHKNIEDLVVGDEVLTRSSSYYPVTEKMVSKFTGKKHYLNISGEADLFECTDNHPILIGYTDHVKHNKRKDIKIVYKRADELNYKYQYALLPKRVCAIKNTIEEDYLYLLGWIMGDGYVNEKNNKITICLQKNQENIATNLCKIIDTFVGEEYTTSRGRTYSSKKAYITDHDTYVRVHKTSSKLSKFALESGCLPNNKKLSESLYQTKNLMPFVIGLLEADGHQKFNSIGKYKRCNIEIATIYKELLQQVRQILLDNGVYSSMSNVLKGDQLRLNISTNYINKVLNSYSKQLKFKTIDFSSQKYIQMETKEGFWTPIKIHKVEDVEDTVYNIEVKDVHNYIAGNIVNHNCMAFMMCMFAIQEDDLGKEYADSTNSRATEIIGMMDNFYKRN